MPKRALGSEEHEPKELNRSSFQQRSYNSCFLSYWSHATEMDQEGLEQPH